MTQLINSSGVLLDKDHDYHNIIVFGSIFQNICDRDLLASISPYKTIAVTNTNKNHSIVYVFMQNNRSLYYKDQITVRIQ